MKYGIGYVVVWSFVVVVIMLDKLLVLYVGGSELVGLYVVCYCIVVVIVMLFDVMVMLVMSWLFCV